MSSSDKLKIPYNEILSATNNFSETNKIGEGGFGRVYLAKSKQHGLLAIKRLNYHHVMAQGEHEYWTEINLLSKYKHENLVSLIGFCAAGKEMILAYKYEENKSLDRLLGSKDLSWVRRLRICLGSAYGLRFLHDETGVIHRDIKSSNILLDKNWKAKISDFGLSTIALTNSADSVIFTSVCGTIGYIDPEYTKDDTLTQKSDVYSFGVVLYEVLFGKLVGDPDYGRFTAAVARKHYEAKTLHTMINPDLRNQMDSNSFNTFSTIAYQCLNKRKEVRPTMNLVVEALKKALDYEQASRLHDVYISFREQTSSSFWDQTSAAYVDSLCNALEREGLSSYKDDIRTSRSESRLLAAIKESRSYIIIFSKNFAANSWNLDEVAEIMKYVKERGDVVIPVYYDVHPSDVREERGYFGEAMSKYNTHPRIGTWRTALLEATNVPGLKESNFRRCEDLAKEAAARIKKNVTHVNY